MFGYIYVNEQELKLREFTVYRSFYCGICRELYLRFGRQAQLVLNYDMTFLALLLTGLYEPETVKESRRCVLHPLKKHDFVSNDAVCYAADMCVLLAYQKALDDWEDEHKQTGRALAGLLKSGYHKICAEYPRQAKAVEENIRLLHETERKRSGEKKTSLQNRAETGAAPEAGEEQAKDLRPEDSAGGIAADIDYAAGLTGNFLSEIYVWKDDIWQEDLRQIGFYLGKFVYLMDALEDVDKDRKHGNYNVFADEKNVWESGRESEIRAILTGTAAEAARAFERLPVLQNAGILRNILYSGIWCKYAALKNKAEKKSDKLHREDPEKKNEKPHREDAEKKNQKTRREDPEEKSEMPRREDPEEKGDKLHREDPE